MVDIIRFGCLLNLFVLFIVPYCIRQIICVSFLLFSNIKSHNTLPYLPHCCLTLMARAAPEVLTASSSSLVASSDMVAVGWREVQRAVVPCGGAPQLRLEERCLRGRRRNHRELFPSQCRARSAGCRPDSSRLLGAGHRLEDIGYTSRSRRALHGARSLAVG